MTLCSKNIAGIILAAGTASRMGQTKQLLPYGDTTLLGQVVSHALTSDLEKIIIILGHDAQKIRHDLDKRFDLSTASVKKANPVVKTAQVVINDNYMDGQSTSLIKGITHLSHKIDGAMFLLGDQPLVTPAIINHLINAFKNTNAPIIIPFYNSNRGNPVIISKALFPQLKKITADTGARTLFEKYKQQILKVPIDDFAIIADVDTPEDYNKLIS